jgi:hypothetical protein
VINAAPKMLSSKLTHQLGANSALVMYMKFATVNTTGWNL